MAFRRGSLKVITIKNGDLFSATEGIICHQVNCKGKMGRGVAAIFPNYFPAAYKSYLKFCNIAKEDTKVLLGHCLFVDEENGSSCCMFAQDDWRGHNKRNTDYEAFKVCCERICLHAHKVSEDWRNYPINMPYKIGCGLGGGDWNIVFKILEEQFKDYNLILWRL